jgi:hypothetical protein
MGDKRNKLYILNEVNKKLNKEKIYQHNSITLSLIFDIIDDYIDSNKHDKFKIKIISDNFIEIIEREENKLIVKRYTQNNQEEVMVYTFPDIDKIIKKYKFKYSLKKTIKYIAIIIVLLFNLIFIKEDEFEWEQLFNFLHNIIFFLN